MAEAVAKTTITLTVELTVAEAGELRDQLDFLVRDNRGTEVTRVVRDALDGWS